MGVNQKCMENGGCRKMIVAIEGEPVCLVFPSPDAKWRTGTCPMATNLVVPEKKEAKKLNPIKASKKASKGA